MTTINNVTLNGYLAQEPEFRETKTGHRIAQLVVATSWTNKAGKEFTNYHRVIAWNHFADYAKEFAKKGSFVQLNGRITYRKYKIPGGSERTLTEIFAVELEVLKPKETADAPAEEHFDEIELLHA